MMTTCLLDYFSALDDPRQSWKVCYPLEEVLLIVLCATMAGAEDFVQIERWGNRKPDFCAAFCRLRKVCPRTTPSMTSSTRYRNDKASIKVRRKTLAWDDQYLEKAINGKS